MSAADKTDFEAASPEDIVFQTTRAIAVYGVHPGIVVCQERDPSYQQEEPSILIPWAHVDDVVAAIKAHKKERTSRAGRQG